MASMNLAFDSVDKGTAISQIKVDPRLRIRDSSGLDYVDTVLSGDVQADKRGFVPSTAWLFTGTPGAGKTTMALQLASSLAAQGHSVLYNTGEESLAQVKMCYERLDLKGDFTVGSDVFVDRPAGKEFKTRIKQTLREHIVFLNKRVKEANKGVKSVADQRRLFLIIDSLQCMNDGKYGFAANSKTPIRVLEELTQLCKSEFMTLITIGQVSKSGDFKGDNTLLHMVDGHIHLFIDQDEKSPTAGCRILECRKNRFGPSGIAVPLQIGRFGLSEDGKRGGVGPAGVRGRKV
jgi:DNA repair protein RadA/Sms